MGARFEGNWRFHVFHAGIHCCYFSQFFTLGFVPFLSHLEWLLLGKLLGSLDA